MAEQKPRVWGPYRHGNGYRLHFLRAGKTCVTEVVATEEEAHKLKRALLRELEREEGRTIDAALTEYEKFMHAGSNKPQSVKHTVARLRLFFPDAERLSLGTLTAQDGAALYARLVSEPSKATGKPLAADSHRNYLAEAKTFMNWCVAQGWLLQSPLAQVRGQGRRRRGKAQLGIDESRKLLSVALEQARAGDVGAVAVLVLMLMGLRASELVNLLVRDLDDEGRILWIREVHDGSVSRLKTPAAQRAPKVPALVRPLLVQLAAGRPRQARLFGEHWRDWARKQTIRLCERASLEPITAHGLRGLKATLALIAGEDPEAVARSLGHTSAKVTFSNYAAPGTRQQLEQERLERTLTERSDSGQSTSDGDKVHE